MATGGMSLGIKIGSMLPSDTLGNDLHLSAGKGNKRTLKKVLERGIHVDYPNSEGQSPLFIACFENHQSTADVLLLYGANPNERSSEGITPVHMACYSGNVKLLRDLLEAGGDLRLHDNFGRSAKDWALMQADPKKRMKVIEFLEKTRLFALTKSGRDLRIDNQTSNHNSFGARKSSIAHLIRETLKGNSHNTSLEQLKSCHSMGFGKVYQDGDSTSGFMGTIPLISDGCLKHDSESLSFENGFFMVMESMLWKNTRVTVKRLHKEQEIGADVDFLIHEMEQLRNIRHQNILLLIGVCQTNYLESLVLIFEHIEYGSLYYFLHEKFDRLPSQQILDVLQQMCDALIFLHDQHLIHCFLTSHAVNFIKKDMIKLGNFEYMVESDKRRKTFVTTNEHQNAAYNWMAPEIMTEHPPSAASDMYSFCVLLWEMLHLEIPWGRYDAVTIRAKVISERQQLPLKLDSISEIHKIIMNYGLQYDPLHRELTFNHVRDILHVTPERAHHYVTYHLGKNNQQFSVQEKRHREKPRKEKQKFGSDKDDPARKERKSEKERPERPSSGPRKIEIPQNGELLESPKEKHNHNQSSSKDIYPQDFHNYQQYQPPADQMYSSKDGMSFDTNCLHWDLEEEQKGDNYFYTVGLRQQDKHKDPEDKGYTYDMVGEKHPAEETDQYLQYFEGEHNGDCSETKVETSESEMETCSTQTSNDNQLETSLARPLTSKFSYLNIKQNRSPREVSIKPASHCANPNVKKAEIQLTNAGSVYALYNMDDECKVTPDKPTQLQDKSFSTMPRKRKRMGMTPNVKELNLFNTNNLEKARGSVRDLVDLFEHQASNHKLRQDVLTGKLKDCITSEKTLDEQIVTQQQMAATIDQSMNGNVKDDDIVVKGSSSLESDIIEEWVSQELKMVRRTLSEEIFQALHDKQKEQRNSEKDTLKNKDLQYSRPGKQQSHSKKSSKGNRKVEVEKYIVGELKDVINENNHTCNTELQNINTLRQNRLQRQIGAKKSSFANIPLQITDDDVDSEYKHPTSPHHYPDSQQIQIRPDFQKLQVDTNKQGAFISSVTVRTSVNYPDHHTVTHTITNMQKGTTDTLYTKTVKASRVVSAHFAPDVP